MYLATTMINGNLVLINVLHNEADKVEFQKEINDAWNKYSSQITIRYALMAKISHEIGEELKNTVDLPKIPLIRNDGLSDKYADALRDGKLNDVEMIMQQIKEISSKNHEIRKKNRDIDKKNYEARKNPNIAKSVVLSRLSDEERAIYNLHINIPPHPANVDIVEIDINNFVPVTLKADIYEY